MYTFRFLFSDLIMLPLLELFVLFVFFLAVFVDIRSKIRPHGVRARVKRGEKSWSNLLTFWALSIIIIQIIISSELIFNHRVIIGLLNLGVLIYLNLFSSYFKNKIIGWSIKLKNIED